jgi:hypothetical protein
MSSRFLLTAALIPSLLAAATSRAQDARTLRFDFQPGEVYHYDVEFGMTFVAGETRNAETIRGVETLVVVEREDDTVTLLPVASGLRVADMSIHGEGLEAYADGHRQWTEPFFGTGLLFETAPDVPAHAFLGKLVARVDDMGRAPVEWMVPRFWSLLIPIGEWMQNYVTAAGYPWPILPTEAVMTGQEWDLTFPGWPDTFHFSYEGPDATGELLCELVRGELHVAPETSSDWGATKGVDIRTTLCLAHEGFPVREGFQASQVIGDGQNEQWIRAELVGRLRLDDSALETVRQAADTAFATLGEPDPETLQDLVGKSAPPLELAGPDGGTQDLSELTAQVTVVHFWAPWSSQSSQTLSGLLALRADFEPAELALLPVMVEDEASRLLGLSDVVLARMDSTALGYRPAINDLPAYHANGLMPVTLILDEQRIVRKAYTGYVGRTELHDAIRDLLPPR